MFVIAEGALEVNDNDNRVAERAERPNKKRSKIGCLFETMQQNTAAEQETPPAGTVARRQFDTYLALVEKNSLTFDDDPLSWWREFGAMIPDLRKIARSYLSVQATSCSSERMFSRAGYIVSRYRSSLHTNNVAMLTFLAINTPRKD